MTHSDSSREAELDQHQHQQHEQLQQPNRPEQQSDQPSQSYNEVSSNANTNQQPDQPNQASQYNEVSSNSTSLRTSTTSNGSATTDNQAKPLPNTYNKKTSQHRSEKDNKGEDWPHDHHDTIQDDDDDDDDDEEHEHDDPVSIHSDTVNRRDSNVSGLSSQRANRQPSNTLSSISRSSSRVPLAQRRGLLAFLTIVPEYHNPRDYPNKLKYILVSVVAFAAITGPMGTSIMLPAITDIIEELDTSASVVNISVGIYLLSLGIFPLWWSAFSERHGRRSVYIIANAMFLAFTIGAALSPNIAALVVLRFLSGCGGSAVQSVGAGTIGDLFAPHERGTAMGVYYLGPLLGPFLSPIIGGAVAMAWGWRATMYTLVIFIGVSLATIIFVLPETCKGTQMLKQRIRDHLEEEERHSSTQDDEADVGKLPDNIDNGVDNPGKYYPEKLTPVQSRPQSLVSSKSRKSHHYTEADLDRIVTNLSRQSSHRQLELLNEQDEDPVVDPVMPTLSRVVSNVSNVSRKSLQNQQQFARPDQRFHDQLDQLNQPSRTGSHHSMKEKNELHANSFTSDHRQYEQQQQQPFMAQSREFAYDYFIRPMHSVVLLSYPPVALVITYSAICFACVYFFNMTISYEYAQAPYNFSSIIIGLMYIPNSVTYFCASILGGRWNDYLLTKYAKSHNGEIVPESRISWNVVIAVILYPPACLIFGWCLKFGEHWVTPLIGTALFGFASMLVIGTTVTYLVDILPGKGATGVALNNLIRQILAAIATFVVEPALTAIGPGVLFSILMGIITLASVAIWFLKKEGAAFRARFDLESYYERL